MSFLRSAWADLRRIQTSEGHDMTRNYIFALAVFGMTVLSATVSHACRGYDAESVTFLPELPAAATKKPVIARIVILSTDVTHDGKARVSRVRVKEGIKGAATADTLDVVSGNHSCAGDAGVKPGQIYFIAGDVADDGLFHGEWRRVDINPVPQPRYNID